MRVVAIGAPVVCVGLLSAMTVQRSMYASAEDVAPYHAHIREVVEQVPAEFGDWKGTDEPVPPAAVALLKPNVILSRRYVNETAGRRVDLLIVHCRDARDIAGHYPPICYPSHGWQEVSREMGDWTIDDQHVGATVYRFGRDVAGQPVRVVVVNLIVLPDGTMARDMQAVRAQAADYRSHFYGAAQVQFVFPATVGNDDREQTVQELLELIRPVLAAVGQGVVR